MNTRMILASLLTAATLAACSSPIAPIAPQDVGAQPTLEELNADNDSSLELSGTNGGLGNLLVRKIYDTNQNGKRDEEEPGIPDWGVRIVSVDENGNPDDAADVQVTPQGGQRWRGVNLKVPFGRYKIEELEPTSTKQAGVAWKVTGKPSRTVNVSRSNPLRAIEFAGVCLENGAVVKFPKLADFADWKCRASFDLLPRIGSFTATPAQIQPGGSSALKWNVLDYSKLEITPTVGVVTGFTGSKNVTSSSTTAYTLKATNGFGSRTTSVTVNVGSIMKWQTPQVLIPSRVGLTTVELFKNNQGQPMVVTSCVIPGTNTSELMIATYSAAQGWSSFQPIALLPYASGNPSIRASVAANGDMFVSYSPTEAFEKTVLVFRRPNGGNWDAGNKLPLGFVIPNGGPGIDFAAVVGQLKTDSFGNAFFLASGCLQAGGFKQNCQKTATRVVRYTPTTGWSAPTELVVNAGNTQQNPLLSVAANGNALSVWTDVPTATDNGFRYASFTPNAGWQAPRAVDVGMPKFLGHTANGQAILISQGQISQGGSLLCRTVIAPALGIADCINLVPINPNSAVAMNSKGEVMAVVASTPSFITDNPFTNNLRPTELFAIRYLPGTGWGVPQALVSGRQDGLNLIGNPSDSFNTVSINENAVALVGTAIFDKVTPDQGPTSTFTNVSIRLNPNSEQAGTPEPIWAASSSQAQIFPDGLEVLPDNSAVAVGIAAEFSANGIPVPALLSNTYR